MGKSILITRASSGIGKALSFELAKRGYCLALTARRTDLLKHIRTEIQARHSGRSVEIRYLDVTDYPSVPFALEELAKALNGLDVVFVNAGIGLGDRIGRGQFDKAKRTVETNLLGAMATVDAAAAYFRERGRGHIVGVSSVAAFRGTPRNASYSASKAGFANYLDALRTEFHRKDIYVTVLYPGYIDTPLNDMLSNRPFLIPAEKGAAIIARLIEKKVKSSTVPVFPWKVIAPLLKWLPTGVLVKMG